MHFRSLPFLVSNSGSSSSSSSSSEIVPRLEGQTQQSTKLDKEDVVSNDKEGACCFPNPTTVLKTPQDVLQPSSRFCAKPGATPRRSCGFHEVSNSSSSSSSSTSSERPFMGLEHQKQLGKRNADDNHDSTVAPLKVLKTYRHHVVQSPIRFCSKPDGGPPVERHSSATPQRSSGSKDEEGDQNELHYSAPVEPVVEEFDISPPNPTAPGLLPIASNCMVENWEMIQKEWDDYLIEKFGRDGRRLEAYSVVSLRQLKSTGKHIKSTDIRWGSFMSCFRDN
jgi:hypothetical protein